MQALGVGKSCSHENQPTSKPHYQRGCAAHAKGGGEQAQSLGSSMKPPKRAKECRLKNFLVRPVQAEQAQRMLAIHIIKSRPFCSTHVTTAAAERNWSAWPRTYSFAQKAEQRNSRELFTPRSTCLPAGSESTLSFQSGCKTASKPHVATPLANGKHRDGLGAMKGSQPHFKGSSNECD
eukprot:1140334-Pelagomonas_calceolata.AAC.5